MGLDLSKLEKVRHYRSKTIARCPACAEKENDRKGEHLFMEWGGRFGCVVWPGIEGREHRKRIFDLVGIKNREQTHFAIRQTLTPEKTILKDVMGRLGQVNSCYTRNISAVIDKSDAVPQLVKSVPAVPNESMHLYTSEEMEILRGMDSKSIVLIDKAKRLFNGTISRMVDEKSNDLGNFVR